MDTDQSVRERVQQLGSGLEVPPVDPADDLGRGRSRLLRRRIGIATVAVAVSLAVASGGALADRSGLVRLGRENHQAAAPPSGSASASGSPTPTAVPTRTPTRTPTDGVSTLPRVEETPTDRQSPHRWPSGSPSHSAEERAVHLANRTAVASHLDPAHRHISTAEIRNLNFSGSGGPSGAESIVEKIGWTNPGKRGLGLIAVTISNTLPYDCRSGGSDGPDTACTRTRHAGLAMTKVVERGEPGAHYLYRRGDGYWIEVDVDLLYGNNSRIPVSAISLSDRQLAAVYTDPTLTIPGTPPAIAPTPPTFPLRDTTRSALDQYQLTGEYWDGTNDTYAAEVRRNGRLLGDVNVSSRLFNFGMDDPCETWYAKRCEIHTVDGVRVRVVYRAGNSRSGSGIDLGVDGPTRQVGIHWDPAPGQGRPVSIEKLIDLVTDPRYQR